MRVSVSARMYGSGADGLGAAANLDGSVDGDDDADDKQQPDHERVGLLHDRARPWAARARAKAKAALGPGRRVCLSVVKRASSSLRSRIGPLLLMEHEMKPRSAPSDPGMEIQSSLPSKTAERL